MANLLKIELRKSHGKRRNRRMRYDGKTPGVIYGQGEESQSVQLVSEQLESAVRHGAKVVELEGAASGKALMQEVTWDTFFHEVLHVDLLRVKAGQKVTVEVPIGLHGEAPGSRDGGILEQMIHSVEIEVPLDLVPDKLHININHLQIGQELLIKDISDLPAGATVLVDADEIVVHCMLPTTEEEAEAEGEAGSAEPEVIGKGKDEEEEGAEAEEKE